MQDRDIFNDLLAGTKHSINCYTNAIQETNDQQLRSTWQTLRDEAEQLQYQIYQMSEQKGYYVPAPEASKSDIQEIKASLTSAINSVGGGAIDQNMMQGQKRGNSQQGQAAHQTMTSQSMTDMSGSVNNNMMNMQNSKQSQSNKKKK